MPAAAGLDGDREQLSAATEVVALLSVLLLHLCALRELALGGGGDHRVEDDWAVRKVAAEDVAARVFVVVSAGGGDVAHAGGEEIAHAGLAALRALVEHAAAFRGPPEGRAQRGLDSGVAALL